MSARRQISGRSRVREWATVTVQSAPSSRAAIGLPTMLERPTITASLPRESLARPASRAGGRGSHRACRGRAGRRAARGRPRTDGRHSVGGSRRRPCPGGSRAGPPRRRSARGRGSWTRMPWVCGSRLSASIRPSSSSVEMLTRQLDQLAVEPGLGRHPGLGADIGAAGRVVADDQHAQPRLPSRPRGETLRLAATLARSCAAAALPSMTVAAMLPSSRIQPRC